MLNNSISRPRQDFNIWLLYNTINVELLEAKI